VAYLEFSPGDPRSVGQYRLLGRLDDSGMGQVYLAQSRAGRTVALKVLPEDLAADPVIRTRFTHGVAAGQRVEGRFTAAVVDAEVGGPRPWVATAYVPGPTLGRVVAHQGPLPELLLLALGAGLAEGVREIHAAGVVHRDLQPSNVVLGSEGPRIVDFGIAVPAESAEPAGEAQIVGTHGFMSPEQARGDRVGPPSDIFSLGAVLTFAATGSGPFERRSIAASPYQVINAEPGLALVPEVIWPLLTRCLAKDPAARPSAAELAAATYELAARDFSLDEIALGAVMEAISGWSGREAVAGATSTLSRTVWRSAAPAASPTASLPRWVSGASQHPPPPAPVAPDHAYAPLPDESTEYRYGGPTDTGAPALAEDEPRVRFLTGILPERAPADARLSLLVMITLERFGTDPAVRRDPSPPAQAAAPPCATRRSGITPIPGWIRLPGR
jgi:serine/threonine protein kinase